MSEPGVTKDGSLMKDFYNHVSSYGLDIYAIKLKYLHSLKVMDLCAQISESLGLTEEDIRLSKLIGLFHDIGRFPQWIGYKTYDDVKSISHAHFGSELMEMRLLEEFGLKLTEEERYLFLLSIYHHTDRILPPALSKREKLFCDIVRDADKIDILRYFVIHIQNNDLEFMLKGGSSIQLKDSAITPFVFQQVRDQLPVKREDIKTAADSLMTYISFSYQLNFDISRKILRNTGYYDEIFKIEFEDPKTRMEFEEIKGIVRNSLI